MSLKKALAHYDAGLAAVPATALCAGLGAYLLAHVLLRYRISRTIGHGRPVAPRGAAGASGRSPTTCLRSRRCRWRRPIFVVLIAYEGIRYREPRSFIRHGAVPTAEAMRAQRARQANGQLLVDRACGTRSGSRAAQSSSGRRAAPRPPRRSCGTAGAPCAAADGPSGVRRIRNDRPSAGLSIRSAWPRRSSLLDAEDRGRKRHHEQLGERGRRQRPVRADRDVERVVVWREVGSLERDLDQTLALLLRPEDFEEDRRWAGGRHQI